MELDSEEDEEFETDSVSKDDEDEQFESSEEEIDTEEGSNDDCLSYEEESVYAYIKKFPFQMICLEKCQGTLDELFIKNFINEENCSAILFQIIITLITYQKIFHFTHNDLHTNNIMYVDTDIEYLYYKYNSKLYKIKTFGKILKIIDFGRSIYKFQGKIYCSDSFAPSGDAHSQYNTEPFIDVNKPRIEPNYSFDLCRLGISIYDYVIHDKLKPSEMDHFQQTIYRWCKDDNDKNILYMRDGSERYPSFKLYKMIARTVHNHTPENQLKFEYFSQYLVDNINQNEKHIYMDIDSIPIYTQ